MRGRASLDRILPAVMIVTASCASRPPDPSPTSSAQPTASITPVTSAARGAAYVPVALAADTPFSLVAEGPEDLAVSTIDGAAFVHRQGEPCELIEPGRAPSFHRPELEAPPPEPPRRPRELGPRRKFYPEPLPYVLMRVGSDDFAADAISTTRPPESWGTLLVEGRWPDAVWLHYAGRGGHNVAAHEYHRWTGSAWEPAQFDRSVREGPAPEWNIADTQTSLVFGPSQRFDWLDGHSLAPLMWYGGMGENDSTGKLRQMPTFGVWGGSGPPPATPIFKALRPPAKGDVMVEFHHRHAYLAFASGEVFVLAIRARQEDPPQRSTARVGRAIGDRILGVDTIPRAEPAEELEGGTLVGSPRGGVFLALEVAPDAADPSKRRSRLLRFDGGSWRDVGVPGVFESASDPAGAFSGPAITAAENGDLWAVLRIGKDRGLYRYDGAWKRQSIEGDVASFDGVDARAPWAVAGGKPWRRKEGDTWERVSLLPSSSSHKVESIQVESTGEAWARVEMDGLVRLGRGRVWLYRTTPLKRVLACQGKIGVDGGSGD